MLMIILFNLLAVFHHRSDHVGSVLLGGIDGVVAQMLMIILFNLVAFFHHRGDHVGSSTGST
jgi:hypothetical protein